MFWGKKNVGLNFESWLRVTSQACVGCCPQNDLYWDDWSRMGIFKAPKTGSQNNELIVGRLTGVMDLKIFYKGKSRGKEQEV